MPEYSNPELPEDVNNSDQRPLRSFLALAGAALAIGIALALAFAFFGGRLARHLPFETELRLIGPHAAKYPGSGHVAEQYLQRVAERLAGHLGLPAGMVITVHYVNEPVINAFATLGGHVAVYRGLLERMPDENTLAMVLAHEIGHIRHRHPITSLGRGIAFSAVLTLVSAGAGSSAADSILGNAGMLTLLTFSRSQEEEADEAGIAALAGAYGHAGGATGTFEVLRTAASERGRTEPPKFLNTHPVTRERIERISELVRRGRWAADGPRTPLPEAVRQAVEKDAKETKPRK